MNHKPQVLFFSVGDSTRSQIAEGFSGDSRATQSVEIDPLTRDVMRELEYSAARSFMSL